VRRVAKDLIANYETEISEVVRRRLVENLGSDKIRKNVARAFGDWCFERRAQLPPEWTAVDSAATEAKAREFLQRRFEACYPFHPATLSVFQRKWQALPQYQQTRGTLAMLAQWISLAAQDAFRSAGRDGWSLHEEVKTGQARFRVLWSDRLRSMRLRGRRRNQEGALRL
jgi:predicted AAA+ superfamily ATPase